MTHNSTITKAAAPPPIVYTDEHPEFPKLLYNHETRKTAGAADKAQQEALAKDGFVEEPLPPEDPASLTPDEVTELQALLAKAAKALAKLGELSKKESETTKPSERFAEKK